MVIPTVTLQQGTYRGLLYQADDKRPGLPKAVEAYLGVPYARVTERFGRASVVGDGNGTYNATSFGQLCPGFTSQMDMADGWEVGTDCLSANIFRPADGKRNLPVVVYFHGGAFNVGRGADRDMASFVGWSERGVVAVSFNYRLGALGFLSCRAMEECGRLNLGLWDQRAALKWVASNIERFGGDPRHVTALGVSAGAHSIGHHILSADVEEPLFQKAILESGAATARCILSPSHDRQETQFSDFISACEIPAGLSPRDTIAALQHLPVSRIIKAAGSVWVTESPTLRWPFQPTIDGPRGIIPDLPVASSVTSASYVPIITGFNTHEGVAFVDAAGSDTSDDFRNFFHNLIPGLQASDLDKLESLYPEPAIADAGDYLIRPPGCAEQFTRLAAAYADQAYIAPVLHTAHRNSRQGVPVYVYEFAARGQPYSAANHGSEGDMVTRDVKTMQRHRGLMRISEKMHGLFSQFIVSETAGSLSMPDAESRQNVAWPMFESPFGEDAGPDAGKILVFGCGNNERAGGTSEGMPTMVRRLTQREIVRCKFWWDLMPLSQGRGDKRGSSVGTKI